MMNFALIVSLNRSHAPNVTKSGAKFVSSVEFATDVNRNDQCQTARSPVKNRPATTINAKSLRSAECRAVPLVVNNHAHKNGSAKSRR